MKPEEQSQEHPQTTPQAESQEQPAAADQATNVEEGADEELAVEQTPEQQWEAERAQLENEKADLEDRLVRTQAELVNYRRRTQNEMEQFRKYEGINLVRDLLPVFDNLQRAIQAADQAANAEDVKTGVEMVYRQLLETLTKYKIETITSAGEAFDPNRHEAVQQMPSEEQPAMHVLHELQTGYQMHDRVVRPSKVIVSTGPAAAPESK